MGLNIRNGFLHKAFWEMGSDLYSLNLITASHVALKKKDKN